MLISKCMYLQVIDSQSASRTGKRCSYKQEIGSEAENIALFYVFRQYWQI